MICNTEGAGTELLMLGTEGVHDPVEILNLMELAKFRTVSELTISDSPDILKNYLSSFTEIDTKTVGIYTRALRSAHAVYTRALRSAHAVYARALRSAHAVYARALRSTHEVYACALRIYARALWIAYAVYARALWSAHAVYARALWSAHAVYACALRSVHAVYTHALRSVHTVYTRALKSVHAVYTRAFRSGHAVYARALRMSSAPTSAVRSSTPKGMKFNKNASEGGTSVAESLKKTLALLEHSSSKYFSMKSDGSSNDSSSPNTPHKLSTSKINLCNNPCYSPTFPVIMQVMVTDASFIEMQLANLEKAIDGLTKYVWNQDPQINKIVDRVEGLIDKESIHAPRKSLEVHEIKNPMK
ncbi:hypothetical protein FXO37_10201 [Capsicum annuum]|nr:hypothetical protein FXO37_10201 [Capsicum annuum]